ncbi:hypothetical protein [Gracilibacillus sp. YIM 98692]|uniref:hypothetical protein n=1 Tax=Gracilibacillus sp. YIM 98692 TaxID=2663532 RepID=UPI0013D10229|nr:hypothetical protein [Gracilibacillus sp. YIM 98692]
MNTFLHLIDGYLNYQRGKAAGFWGLIGFILVIVVALNGVQVFRFFEFIGVIDFLYNIGVFREGDYFYVSGARLALFILMLLGLFLAGTIIFGFLLMIAPVISPVLLFLIVILAAPLALLIAIPAIIVEWVGDMYLKFTDPAAYKEKKRLQINKPVIESMRYGLFHKEQKKSRRKKNMLNVSNHTKSDKVDNKISYEEAYQRVNRLPTIGDENFVVGVGYDRKIYMILPGPIDAYQFGWTEPGEVRCEEIDVRIKYNKDKLEKDWDINLDNNNPDKYFFEVQKKHFNEFEFFLDLNNINAFKNKFLSYVRNNTFFKDNYVKKTQKIHFSSKNHLLEILYNAKDDDEYNNALEDLNKHTLPNEDIVKMLMGDNSIQESNG